MNQINENIDSYRYKDAELNWRNGRTGDVDHLLEPPLNEEKILWSKYKNYSSSQYLEEIEPNGTLDDYKGHYKNIDPSSSINRSTSDYMISVIYSRLTKQNNKKKAKYHPDKYPRHFTETEKDEYHQKWLMLQEQEELRETSFNAISDLDDRFLYDLKSDQYIKEWRKTYYNLKQKDPVQIAKNLKNCDHNNNDEQSNIEA